jgi:hypothetical protein
VAPEELARLFHDTYEALAPSHGWETQERSRKDWDEVPAENKSLMIAVAARVLDALELAALERLADAPGPLAGGSVCARCPRRAVVFRLRSDWDGWNEVNNPGGHWWCADHDPNRNETP